MFTKDMTIAGFDDVLWQAMCCEWAETIASLEVKPIIDTVEDALA